MVRVISKEMVIQTSVKSLVKQQTLHFLFVMVCFGASYIIPLFCQALLD